MKDDKPADALAKAWSALDRDPADVRAKRLIAGLLHRDPELLTTDRKPALKRLLSDPDVDPASLAGAGWSLLLKEVTLGPGVDLQAAAISLERNGMALDLLEQACVTNLEVELALTRVRRWLLLSARWGDYPLLSEGLVAQAILNGGAWPFEPDEREALAGGQAGAFQAAFLPPRPSPARQQAFADGVTREVANQYMRWPYPVWSRITPSEPDTLPHYVEQLDGGRPNDLPTSAQILIAGCGTGREAARIARRFPDAHVTAIDLSATSLAYAAERCAGLGIDFVQLDLHEVKRLGQQFDFIACSGVLHHLPHPEAGWARLVEVLKTGGVMKMMVYSRVARLQIEAAKLQIADLRDRPVDDDLIRAVRRRIIDRCPAFVAKYSDFYSLGGTHDLLLNAHEDCFDVPRIARALEALRLDLLAFKLPTAADETRYRSEHPNDPLLRDPKGWVELELARPFLFKSMYEFWCRKPA